MILSQFDRKVIILYKGTIRNMIDEVLAKVDVNEVGARQIFFTKHNLCVQIISLENEIEFLKEIHESVVEKKKELRKLYKRLIKSRE